MNGNYMHSEVSFKDIIFIPFKETVAYSFLLLNYLSMLLYMYVIGYSVKLDEFQIIVTVTESLYAVHTALLILHRLMKTHRIKRYYQPAPIAVIIMDVIVIIPFGTIAQLLERFTWIHLTYLTGAYTVAYYVKLLRCVRIFLFFREYRSNLKLNRKIILPLIHFVISTLFSNMMAVAYYRLSCYGCNIPNWSNRLEEFVFNPENRLEWALICYFCSYTLQLHNANGLLMSMTSEEFIIGAIILLVGIIIQFMYLTGSLISEYIQRMKFKFQFEHKVINVRSFMHMYGMPPEVQKNVRKYYEEVWNRRKGLIDMPSSFKLFPPEFQMEIKTDIYWEAIYHTHIFSLFDIAFKKELSSIMTTQILLPNQDFYTIGNVRSKMVYLASGILEVMTPENLKSPVVSLSSGTVLGETACIVPTVSSAKVRSATICELHILEHHQLAVLMKKYSYLQKTLKRIWLRRIWFAKLKRDNLTKCEDSMTHIFWIKSQWRRLLKLGLGEEKNESRIYNKYHTSRFLDLLVLSTQDELKVGSICIKGSCSFVIQPNSGWRQFWDYISLISIIVEVFGTAHLVFYHESISPMLYPLTTTLDLIYILDVYVQAITAVNVHGVLISKPTEVFLHRAKQFGFMVDVIAALPLDYAFDLMSFDYAHTYFRITKFLKVYKVFSFLIARQNLLTAKVITYQLLRYFVQHSIVLVMLVGLMYVSNCQHDNCKEHGWLKFSEKSDPFPIQPYLKTIYYTTSMYFSMNISKIHPVDVIDLIVHFIVYVIGYYMCAFSFVRFCASFALKNEEDFLFNLKLEQLETMINERSELLPMKQLIIQFTRHQYAETKGLTLEDLPIIMDQKSDYLKKIIRKEFLLKILKRSAMFHHFNQEFLERLANLMKIYAVPKDHVIIKSKSRSFHLYAVIKGTAKYQSTIYGDVEKQYTKFLKTYEIFPVLGVVHRVPVFLEVTTVTACQIACIPYLEMEQLIRAYPFEHTILTKALEEHMQIHGNMIARKPLSYLGERSPPAWPETVDSFKYNILQESVETRMKKSYIGLARQKYREYLYILAWKTYDPNGRFVLFYEILRSMFVLGHIIEIQLSLLPVALKRFWKTTYVIESMQIFSLADMYIRAHYQYYNSFGIKVTHPLWTFRHYFMTSLLIDVIANFPVNLLQLNMIVDPHNETVSYILLILITRLFFLIRPYMLINYLENKVPIKLQLLYKIIKISVFALFIAGHISCFQILYNCPLDENLEYNCGGNSWIAHAANHYSIDNVFFISFYSTATLTSAASFNMYTNSDYVITLIKASIVFFFKLLYFSEIIGNRVFENSKLSNYQDGIYHYIEFTKTKYLSRSDSHELLEHYKNMWKKSRGEIPSVVFDNLYPLLKNRACSAMYTYTLGLSPIWSNSSRWFLGLLSTYLEERHFKKGAEIIRCNDVQDMVYIVYKGSASVIQGGMELYTLDSGGIFGSFQKTGFTRHTISVKARVHICVLCIKTIQLYQVARIFPEVTKTLHKLHFENQEYIPVSRNTVVSMSHSTVKHQESNLPFYKRTLEETNSYYVIWHYLASVHVAAISSIWCLFLLVLGKFIFMPIWIILDIYYLIDIYLKTHATFTDFESGLKVKCIGQILKKYSRSYMLYVDIFSTIPLYLFTLFNYHTEIHSGYFLINKMIRIVYLWDYYWQFVLKKNVPRHIRWIFDLYITLFTIQLLFSLWLLMEYGTKKASFYTVTATYLHVMNLFTNAGIFEKGMKPLVILVMNLILLTVSHCMSVYLLIVVSRILLMKNNHIAGYKLKTELIESYCTQLEASPYIIERGWNYLIYLYRRQKGEQIPKLLKGAPPYIIQDHMTTLFGRYFERHFIFCNVHKDFLRQLYMYINLCIYLPDDVIVESGDVNGTLYFIDEGTVMSIEKLTESIPMIENLSKGEWFGEVQGILKCPHEKSYHAVTVCSIMSLRKSDWTYLLKWFPATEETLYELARVCHEAR